MKAKWHIPTIVALTAIVGSQTRAIEAPPDDATPPKIHGAEAVREVPNQAPFIGVVTDALPEVLSAQLGLHPQEGIIVKSVMPDGPAEKAGIQAHDIITRIGDESLSAPEDLRRIVRKHKAGDTIEVGLIRKGRSAAIKVTLSERPDHNMANHKPRPLQDLNLQGVPDEMAERMRNMIEGNVREFQWPRGHRDPFGGMNQDFEESFRRMHEQMEQLQRLQLNPPAEGAEGINMQQSMTIRMLDNNGSIELSTQNGKRNLTVRDQDNKTLWTGPWNTDEDKAAAPEDIRQRVEKLNIENSINGSALRFRFGTDN